MKALIIVLIFAFSCVYVNILSASSDLAAYCDDPTIALTLLKELRFLNWNSLSVTDIQSKWPTSLHETHDCDAHDQSQSCLVYIHRAKDKEFCCCGVSFYFDTSQTEKAAFNAVVLNIANRSREKVLSFLNEYLESMTPVVDEVFVDPWKPPGWNFVYNEGSVLKAYSFISPSSNKIEITVALQPLGDVQSKHYYWWLRLTMTNEH
jgi:hypothetical protein